MAGAQLATEVHTTAVGQANVQDRNVDVGDVEGQRLVEGSGLGDNFEVPFGLEEFAKAPTHNLVVVNEE
jgi:hypothetical protein